LAPTAVPVELLFPLDPKPVARAVLRRPICFGKNPRVNTQRLCVQPSTLHFFRGRKRGTRPAVGPNLVSCVVRRIGGRNSHPDSHRAPSSCAHRNLRVSTKQGGKSNVTLRPWLQSQTRLSGTFSRVGSHPPTSRGLNRFHGQKNGPSGDAGFARRDRACQGAPAVGQQWLGAICCPLPLVSLAR
jgi:hypothetical protein